PSRTPQCRAWNSRTAPETEPVARSPLHLLQMTFFCRDSFRVAPLYRSSRDTESGCTTVLPDHRTERNQTQIKKTKILSLLLQSSCPTGTAVLHQ
uniref:Uncharacterized protein n=1 Tax=Pelusios castaneus TaxID=367368 RepID=A0A8C8SQX5_9SAUR